MAQIGGMRRCLVIILVSIWTCEAGFNEIPGAWGGGRNLETAKALVFRPAVVFLAYNRPDSLRTTLESFENLKGREDFTAYVSVDSGGSVDAIAAEVRRHNWIRGLWVYKRSEDPVVTEQGAKKDARFFISRHYYSVLERAMEDHENDFTHLILFEDDFLFAPDILQYFKATNWLLEVDNTLFCISAWNDNGFLPFTVDKTRLKRTDIFPGLGWMMKRSLWTEELKASWPVNPSTGWDHWLRLPDQSRGRSCIFPEISRVFHFASKGSNVSAREFKSSFEGIQLQSEANVDYGDLRYLLEDNYSRYVAELIDSARRLRSASEIPKRVPSGLPKTPVYLLPYKRELYTANVGRRLGIFLTRRGAEKGATILHQEKLVLILADVRTCPYLKTDERVLPAADAVRVTGELGESCTHACNKLNRTCNAGELEFLNDCHVLKQHFPCENGCGFEIGKDLPAHVLNSATVLQTHGQCLVTDGSRLDCEGNYPYTRRICACL